MYGVRLIPLMPFQVFGPDQFFGLLHYWPSQWRHPNCQGHFHAQSFIHRRNPSLELASKAAYSSIAKMLSALLPIHECTK